MSPLLTNCPHPSDSLAAGHFAGWLGLDGIGGEVKIILGLVPRLPPIIYQPLRPSDTFRGLFQKAIATTDDTHFGSLDMQQQFLLLRRTFSNV